MHNLRPLIFVEAMIVVVIWSSAILIPTSLIAELYQTLPRALRDPIALLNILVLVLLNAVGLWMRQRHENFLRLRGTQPSNASWTSQHMRWSSAAAVQMTRKRDTHWIYRQVILNMLFNIASNRWEAARAKLDSPDTTLPSYTYKRLSGSRYIRLISLDAVQGDTANATISCSMEEVPLDSAPPFVALSYAWDSPEGTEDLVCDGARLTVTRNCFAALRSIQETPFSDERHVWVDAICINQAATPEKHRQISIMGDIYRTAASVRVWLGHEDESSNLVCYYFRKISEELGPDPESDPISTGLEMAQKWPEVKKCLADFFSRSWFTRAWPIQEVTLPMPGRVYVVCGLQRLPFKCIRVGWTVLHHLDILPASAIHDQPVALQFYLADAIALKRGLVAGSARPQGPGGNSQLDFGKPLLADLSQFSFTSVMHAMRFKACRDAKDRFFSLHGVFDELEIDHGIPISAWNQTDAEVFRAVALACFKLDGHLGALRLSQLPDAYLGLSDSLLLSSSRNPYDRLTASMLAMTGRVLGVARNLAAGREVCYHAPTSVWQTVLPSWVPNWSLAIPAHVDAEHQISLISAAAGGRLDDEDETAALPALKGPHLLVEIKMVGRVDDLGTVDSVDLLWQVLFNGLKLSSPQTYQNSDTLDPAVSALAETLSNHVWRPLMAEFHVSLRMARRALSNFDSRLIFPLTFISTYFRCVTCPPPCDRFPCIAACPTVDSGMRAWLHPFVGIHCTTGVFAISSLIPIIAFFISVRSWPKGLLLRLAATHVAFWLLWDFGASLVEILLRFTSAHWAFYLPTLEPLIWTMQELAVGKGDVMLYVLASALGIATKFILLLTLLGWAWKSRLLKLLVVLSIVPRTARDPVRVLRSLFGATRFRRPGAYTHGVYFFATDTGIMGSTSGPVLRDDCLVKVRGSRGCLVLRPVGKERGANDRYVVVGAAHVGTQALVDWALVDAVWSQVELC